MKISESSCFNGRYNFSFFNCIRKVIKIFTPLKKQSSFCAFRSNFWNVQVAFIESCGFFTINFLKRL